MPPLHFMNLIKVRILASGQFEGNVQQNNGIFGAATPTTFEQKAAVATALLQQQQQSRKWPRHDRKQRELETKLALMLCSIQVPMHKLNDPFLRDFLAAQSKFQLPSNSEPIEQILTQMHSRALANMKISLAAASKVTLMVDALKPGDGDETDKADEKASIPLCISVAYYAQAQQRVEVAFLGTRKVNLARLVFDVRPAVTQARCPRCNSPHFMSLGAGKLRSVHGSSCTEHFVSTNPPSIVTSLHGTSCKVFWRAVCVKPM